MPIVLTQRLPRLADHPIRSLQRPVTRTMAGDHDNRSETERYYPAGTALMINFYTNPAWRRFRDRIMPPEEPCPKKRPSFGRGLRPPVCRAR